ncbi:MAG: ComF family protein [Acidimicrobiia bacterium]
MFRALAEVLLPGTCPGCGAAAEPICHACRESLQPAPPLAAPPGLDGLAVAFAYEGVARELVARLKYRNARAGVSWLAAAMLDRLPHTTTVDVVTWAPTTPAHRRSRGFDHAELLARSVGRRAGLPVRALLTRLPGPPQTGARRDERQAGPRFRARPDAANRRILLIDDVVTTGATLAAAAGALRRGGASAVLGLTAARTPRG